jgi:hypothetical protein
VVEGDGGIADYALLHSRQHDARCYLIGFDLLHLGSKDLRPLPLAMRKDLLAKLLVGSMGGIVYSEHLEGGGADVFAAACRMGLEGVVSKHRDRPYTSGPCKHGVKVKNNPTSPAVLRFRNRAPSLSKGQLRRFLAIDMTVKLAGAHGLKEIERPEPLVRIAGRDRLPKDASDRLARLDQHHVISCVWLISLSSLLARSRSA